MMIMAVPSNVRHDSETAHHAACDGASVSGEFLPKAQLLERLWSQLRGISGEVGALVLQDWRRVWSEDLSGRARSLAASV